MAFQKRWKLYGFLSCWLVWALVTTMQHKFNSIFAGCAFSLIELTWTFVTSRKARTTFEQFYILVFFFPFIHDCYLWAWQWVSFGSIWRILLTPLVVWFGEIVQGYTLQYLHEGENPAWTYSGCSDSLFHGNIRLSYGPCWWILGMLTELILLVAPIRPEEPWFMFVVAFCNDLKPWLALALHTTQSIANDWPLTHIYVVLSASVT